jgi:hypothetical protein
MYLVTLGKRSVGTVYLITSWRQIKRRDPLASPRFGLTVQPGHTFDDARASGDYWHMRWNPRNKKSQHP